MHSIPTLVSVMSPFPWTIEADAPARDARERMHEEGFRHLPVTHGHELVGILSARDLVRAGDDERVGDLCESDPYVVPDTAPLDAVVAGMAERHVGSVLVTRQDKLVGILTTTDVCRLLADVLGGGPGGSAA